MFHRTRFVRDCAFRTLYSTDNASDLANGLISKYTDTHPVLSDLVYLQRCTCASKTSTTTAPPAGK